MRFELSQQQRLRMGQQLKLAPRVLQSMEILQMPMQALEARIESELESNVALEQADPTPSEGQDEAQPGSAGEGAPDSVAREAARFARAEALHERSSDDDGGESWRERHRLEGEPDSRGAALANLPTRGESLEEILLEQWALCEAPEDVMAAGRVILGYIGESGFLTRTPAQIASDNAIGLPLVEAALKRLQDHLEPAGLAARDLVESLQLQLSALARGEGADAPRIADATLLIGHHLRDLEGNRLTAIRQATGWPQERLDDARALLRHLDPAPARALQVESAPIVRPDVIIEYDPASDAYRARLASGVLPNLKVSEEYARLAKEKATDPAAREMIGEGIRRARWFIDAIEQRGATLLRVVNEVILQQREWLDVGAGALKPLPMIEVAKALDLNVSTISRCVAGKWIATPRGAFELRRLFSGGTETDSGKDISWESVRLAVSEIVQGEDRSNPLSDDAIVRALKGKGITLARRTVVKYREQLGIPVARVRKVVPPS